MKLLYYGESPMNPTGFGHVNRHLLDACSRVCDVTLVATTHYHEDYDHTLYPYRIIGCPLDPVEQRDQKHQRNLVNIEREIKGGDWNIFMYQGDMGWNNDVLVMAAEMQQQDPDTKYTIFYMPIDGDYSIKEAFAPFTLCSVPCVYTEHAKSVIAKYAPDVAENTSVMWLGCDTESFYPLSAEEKRAARLELFGADYLDRFLVLNVNRNQPRKDLARCMAAFHLFHEKHPESSLYLHSVQLDAAGSLPTQAVLVGCDVYKKPAEVMFSDLDLARPWSRAALNKLYNAVDCLVSTAHGEGWGLTTTEAMCAGLPVVVPYNTANMDILGKPEEPCFYDEREYFTIAPGKRDMVGRNARGWGVKSGGDLDHTVFMYQNGASLASVIHAQSFVDTLEYVYYHPDEAQEKAKVARKWCEENTWEHQKEKWVQILQMMKERLS